MKLHLIKKEETWAKFLQNSICIHGSKYRTPIIAHGDNWRKATFSCKLPPTQNFIISDTPEKNS